MKYLITVFALISFATFAQEDESIQKSLDGFKLSKGEIQKSLENLKKEGKISNADYLKALKDLAAMDDAKINDIKKKAIDMVQKNPVEAQKMLESVPMPSK